MALPSFLALPAHSPAPALPYHLSTRVPPRTLLTAHHDRTHAPATLTLLVPAPLLPFSPPCYQPQQWALETREIEECIFSVLRSMRASMRVRQCEHAHARVPLKRASMALTHAHTHERGLSTPGAPTWCLHTMPLPCVPTKQPLSLPPSLSLSRARSLCERSQAS
jgi:hypothetical protein